MADYVYISLKKLLKIKLKDDQLTSEQNLQQMLQKCPKMHLI